MLLNHILLGFAWIMYGVLHSVFASTSFKKTMQKMLGKKYKHYRLAYNIFAFITLAALIWYQVSMDTIQLYSPMLPMTIVGILISVLGLTIMLICIKKYFMGLSGLRSLVQETTYSELIISGIHRHVRHPLYLGTFIFIWGLAVILPFMSLIVANMIITVYTLIAIRFEENKLIAEFGSQYTTYQKTVPMLIPKW